MLAVLVKARKDIIAKLAVLPPSKAGVFLAPVYELTHDPAPPEEKPIDDQTAKFLEQQNEMNKEQLEFFLKAHERHDINLKKNMEFALGCLRKREEIDKA